MACSPDPSENLAKAEWRIREAAGRGAQIICLQELFRSQYFCREENARLFDFAEPIPGSTTEALGRLAQELRVVVIAPIFERRGSPAFYNTPPGTSADGSLCRKDRPRPIPHRTRSFFKI